jgi:hypothetical protein
VLPEGFETLGDSVFGYCYSLKTVTFPAGLKKIGARAFDVSMKLSDIYYGGKKADWEKIEIAEENDFITGLLKPGLMIPKRHYKTFFGYTK